MSTDDFANVKRTTLGASGPLGKTPRPTIVLRAKSPRAMPASDALDMSYLELARLRTAPMGSLFGASAPKLFRTEHRRPTRKRDTW